MKILSSEYYQFRNIQSSRIAFSDEINIICGDNAVGKTSAIEGIYLCAQGRSHRTAKERDFIRFGEEIASVSLSYQDKSRVQSLGITFSTKGKKGCVRNGIPIRKMSEFIGHFRAVLFTPEHLSIVKEGPAMRRGFLDNAISQLDPTYLLSLQRYVKVLQQRNRILAEASFHPEGLDTLDVWSMQLAEEGELLSKKRAEYVERADGKLRVIFSDMTEDREVPQLKYTGATTKEDLYKLLIGNTDREIHKDDIGITVNGKEARSYASQGQQRSLALALKLAEGEISREDTGEYPVFLFDDVLSELDGRRKQYLMAGLSGKQVIITTCEQTGFPENSHVIHAKGGAFYE